MSIAHENEVSDDLDFPEHEGAFTMDVQKNALKGTERLDFNMHLPDHVVSRTKITMDSAYFTSENWQMNVEKFGVVAQEIADRICRFAKENQKLLETNGSMEIGDIDGFPRVNDSGNNEDAFIASYFHDMIQIRTSNELQKQGLKHIGMRLEDFADGKTPDYSRAAITLFTYRKQPAEKTKAKTRTSIQRLFSQWW